MNVGSKSVVRPCTGSPVRELVPNAFQNDHDVVGTIETASRLSVFAQMLIVLLDEVGNALIDLQA